MENILGYIVEDGKIQPSQQKTMAVTEFAEPKIQSFLETPGYSKIYSRLWYHSYTTE